MVTGPLTSAKLVGVAAACTALVRPPAVVQVIFTSLPWGTMEMICNAELLLVGDVPARNSLVLLWPSPSESASPAACGQLVQPKFPSCHHWKAVRTLRVALALVA